MNRDIREKSGPLYNERGVIAEMYSELQGLHVLEIAREAYPLPKASAESVLRAIFQAAEVGLLNLANLVSRAALDIEQRRVGSATVKMSWVHGFHRVMVQLSLMPHQLGFVCAPAEEYGVLRICDSPAFHEYAAALKQFDTRVLQCVESAELPIKAVLAHHSLDSNELHLLHLARVCNHETTIWERNLAEISVPTAVPSYQEFVVSLGMRDMVYDRVLKGDTFFTQFRGLHQIPEILSIEINDRIEMAILDIRAQRLRQAYEHLRCVNILAGGVIASLPPMADNLVTSDYHQIRENLGLTSGSHSVSLHYHLFRDLYQQLWEALANHIVGSQVQVHTEAVIQEAIRQADHNRLTEMGAFLFHLLASECLKLQVFISHWRDAHLHLPRNNLGGDYTKSLTGSQDAIRAVRGMQDAARAKNPFRLLTSARGLRHVRLDSTNAPLKHYFDTPSSLDNKILETTGSITQERFRHVQDRQEVFARECPFTPPPRRMV